jgi:hypothetical protein
MTVPAATVGLTDDRPESRASAEQLLKLACGDDFARWEAQLTATGNCANPVRLRGRIDAIDRTTGEKAAIYDTSSEPAVCCGSRAVIAARTSARPARRCTRATPGRSSGPG